MHAKAGDRLIIKSHRVGEGDRHAEILKVRGKGGEPPYEVRWETDGHETVVYPGSDAMVEHRRSRASPRAKAPS